MGFLNRTGFASSTWPAVQLINAAANTTLTGVQDMKVFVASNSGAFTITLPAGARGQSIEIIDSGDNAGTNVITIAGTIDGATNTTIETNGGTRLFVFNTEWESGGGIERFFTRNAAQNRITARGTTDALAANQLLGGDTGTTYSGSPSNFSNAEANVTQGASGWSNTASMAAETLTIVASATHYNTNVADNAIDGSNATAYIAIGGYITFDFGSTKQFDYLKIRPYSFNDNIIDSVTLEGSNDNVSFSAIGSNITIAQSVSDQFFDISPAQSWRYVRITLNDTYTYKSVAEIQIGSKSYATTTNTFQYRPLTGGASTSFDTSTATFKDENGTNLTDSDILVEFDLAGDSSWSTPQNLTDFRANGILTGTNLWLRFEMVGAKKLGSTSITTASSYADISTGAFLMKSSGVNVGAVLNSNLQTHTLSGDAVTQALAMGTYNNFLVDMNTATTSVTLTATSPIAGQTYYIKVRQTNAGVADLNTTWFAGIIGAAGANPSNNTATDDANDLFVFFYDGTNFILINEKLNPS